ncbi:MAG: type II toxin-antitoxin system HicB family antitoxin [Acidobacteriota bacterium]
MTRKYSIVLEGELGAYSAYVPELPTIVVTAETPEELTTRASDAIRFYFERMGPDPSSGATIQEIEVELPA